MHYLDTNILIYSSINQDPAKMALSQSIVRELFKKEKLLLSPLSLQELIFTLFKLNINVEGIKKTYFLFHQFCQYEINRDIIDSAFEIQTGKHALKYTALKHTLDIVSICDIINK